MGTLFKLAWRNVWRQKRRTTLLIVVVAYASLSTVFFWGMTDGQNESLITNQARFIQAPALITTPAYQDDPDPENALPALDFVSEVKAVNGVREVAPRLELFGLLRSAYASENVMVRGILPNLEANVSNIPKKLITGRMLETQGEVILGEGLAENLDVRLGERVALDVSSLAGAQAAGLILVGTVDVNVGDLDKTTVLIHIDDARKLTGVETATAVALDIARGKEDLIATRVAPTLTDYADIEIYGITALMGEMNQMLDANRVQMVPIGILFAIFAALAVTSTLFVSVLERSREFGMMGAIGVSPPKLAGMVMLEAVIATLVGWLIGLIFGYSLTWLFSVKNIFGALFAATVETFADFGFGDEMYTTNRLIYILYAAATIVFAALFALLAPARKVARMNPAKAMRAE